MKYLLNIIMILGLSFISSKIFCQSKTNNLSEVDSLMKEVKLLTRNILEEPLIFNGLENFCWGYNSYRYNYINNSDSLLKVILSCDSVSINEEKIYKIFFNLKKLLTNDEIVELALSSNTDISLYCFQLLCSDDDVKCKKILEYYLQNKSEIWVNNCGYLKKQKVRDFMLGRLFSSLMSSGRKPFSNREELVKYIKIAGDYENFFDLFEK